MQNVEGPHDCALRLKAGETSFDEDWELDLTSKTGGVSAIASTPIDGSKIWMKIFEEDAMPESVPVEEIDWGWPVWQWALLDLDGDEQVVSDESAPLVAYYGDYIELDGRTFSPSSNDDFTETTLVEVSDSGFESRMVVQGELRNVVKLR